jgi:hypothetical protein
MFCAEVRSAATFIEGEIQDGGMYVMWLRTQGGIVDE